jgi:hypothetical protein
MKPLTCTLSTGDLARVALLSDRHARMVAAIRARSLPERCHVFESGCACYHASQTLPEIENGDVLVILEERASPVVGVACTWPFAVTRNAGGLHALSPEAARSGFLAEPQNRGLLAQAVVATDFAVSLGLSIHRAARLTVIAARRDPVPPNESPL